MDHTTVDRQRKSILAYIATGISECLRSTMAVRGSAGLVAEHPDWLGLNTTILSVTAMETVAG